MQEKIKVKNGVVDVSLQAIEFTDDKGIYSVYSPALNMIGSGDTLTEASVSFVTTVMLYFEVAYQEGVLDRDLQKLGWRQHHRYKHRYNAPLYTPTHIMSLQGISDFDISEQPITIQA